MTFTTHPIRALTFDCYGTLIDWEAGIRAAMGAVAGLKGCNFERLVAEREAAERPLLSGRFRAYADILGESLRVAAAAQGRKLSHAETALFVATMSRWPSFPDSGRALRRLATQYVLAILSNVDTKTLQASAKFFGAPFIALITAEGLKSYKPAPLHWEEALKRLHMPRESVLHVAGSLFHDILPAQALGFETVWINRRGEPVPEGLDPSRVFPDLIAFANELLGAEAVV